MRRWTGGMVMVMGLAGGLAAQEGPVDSAPVAAVHALVDLERAQAWRTDVWTEGDELVVQMTPEAQGGELSLVRQPAAPGLIARARFDGAGRLEALTVRDARKAGVHVRRNAPAAERAAALTPARFPAAKREALLQTAKNRRWNALGANPQVADGELVWRPGAGDRERAVWQVRVTAERDGVEAVFVADLDPMDGSLVELSLAGAR